MDSVSTNNLSLRAISWVNGVGIDSTAANFAYCYIGYPNGPNVDDQFSYLLSDGHGGTGVGKVIIRDLKSATSVAGTSSSSRSGFRDPVVFTASLPAYATGIVVFSTATSPIGTNSLVGGVASLSTTNLLRGTNIISIQYSGDDNCLGSTNTLVQVVTNHPPVAGVFTVTRTAGQSVKLVMSDLAAQWVDADGDILTITGMDATSTNHLVLRAINWTSGVSLSASAANFAYCYVGYPNGANVNDQFQYTLSDGYGGTAVGTVNVAVSSSPMFGQVSSLNPTAGNPDLIFLGHPGYTYRVQRATSVSPANWVSIWTTNAPASGLFHYTDNFGDLGGIAPGAAYYRLSWTP